MRQTFDTGGAILRIGYSRVSTKTQCLDRQVLALKELGCEVIYTEKVSGKNITDRVEFNKMLKILRKGDTVVVKSCSRLSRSTSDLLNILNLFANKGILFESEKEKDIDLSSATGKMQITLLSALVQYERDVMLERQKEGIEVAKKRGVKFGRPKKPVPVDFEKHYTRVLNDEITSTEAMLIMGLSKSRYYRLVSSYNNNNE